MKSHYFSDTDTLLIDLGVNSANETCGLDNDVFVEFDASGKPIRITIEHIKKLIA